MDSLIPVFGILTGIIIPVSVFVWLYYDAKGKRDAVVEIAKHMDDPAKTEKLLTLFDERKKEPIDYRRGGVITLFVGIGLYLLGVTALGALFKGVGLLVGVIGLGTLIAGYLYPNTGQEITNAVERFEGD
jgi:amino acid transporter